MRLALIGAIGQLGSDLADTCDDWDLLQLTHDDLDICDFQQTNNILTELQPECVINTAAFHRVDDCEDEPERGFQVNTYAVRNLAICCQALSCLLVHMSTDYVFDGGQREPYSENDLPNPINAYGVSKLAGEYFVRHLCRRHIIVRSSGLYGVAGASGKGGNFVETMIRLASEGKPIKVVNDQVLTPTFTADLAEKIKELIKANAQGLFHITNTGQCSWYEFAVNIFDLTGLNPELSATTTKEFGAKADRPPYSVLTHRRLIDHGFEDLRPWVDALTDYLQMKGHISL